MLVFAECSMITWPNYIINDTMLKYKKINRSFQLSLVSIVISYEPEAKVSAFKESKVVV